MDLIITIGAIENEKFDAKLEYIAPKGTEQNGAIQFQVRAKVNLNSDFFIRAGYSANANIVLDKRDSVLSIPEGLLQFSGDTAFVEIETATQKFEKRNVTLGLSDGITVEVLAGIKPEDKIKVWNMAEL
jgi:HlyD family secretion protein